MPIFVHTGGKLHIFEKQSFLTAVFVGPSMPADSKVLENSRVPVRPNTKL